MVEIIERERRIDVELDLPRERERLRLRSSNAIFFAMLSVTFASSTANGLMSMPKKFVAEMPPFHDSFPSGTETRASATTAPYRGVQLAERDVEEVAAAARRIEHAKRERSRAGR